LTENHFPQPSPGRFRLGLFVFGIFKIRLVNFNAKGATDHNPQLKLRAIVIRPLRCHSPFATTVEYLDGRRLVVPTAPEYFHNGTIIVPKVFCPFRPPKTGSRISL